MRVRRLVRPGGPLAAYLCDAFTHQYVREENGKPYYEDDGGTIASSHGDGRSSVTLCDDPFFAYATLRSPSTHDYTRPPVNTVEDYETVSVVALHEFMHARPLRRQYPARFVCVQTSSSLLKAPIFLPQNASYYATCPRFVYAAPLGACSFNTQAIFQWGTALYVGLALDADKAVMYSGRRWGPKCLRMGQGVPNARRGCHQERR